MTIRVRVSNTGDLARLSRRLRSASNGGLQRDLTSEIRSAGRPVLSAIRTSVRSLDVGSESGGTAAPDTSTRLRARLAGATDMQPQGTGVRYEVHGSRVGPYGHRLARLTDTELAPLWRYPHFGNRRRWHTNVGRPWFFVTVRAAEPKFAAAVRRAMAATARKIMG